MSETRIDETPKKKRGGQPKNTNAARHCMRGTGKLPRKLAYIQNQLNAFRRELERAVISEKDIGLLEAANINTALKWEKVGALAQRWLTTEHDNLKPLDRLQFVREIARASVERDKAIMALGLGKKKVITLTSYVSEKK